MLGIDILQGLGRQQPPSSIATPLYLQHSMPEPLPDPHIVLHHASTQTTSGLTTTPQPSVFTQEDFMKFAIGLRILGEERTKRFLTYLATLLEERKARKEEAL